MPRPSPTIAEGLRKTYYTALKDPSTVPGKKWPREVWSACLDLVEYVISKQPAVIPTAATMTLANAEMLKRKTHLIGPHANNYKPTPRMLDITNDRMDQAIATFLERLQAEKNSESDEHGGLTGLREVPHGFGERLLAYVRGPRIDGLYETLRSFSHQDSLALVNFKNDVVVALTNNPPAQPKLQFLGSALAVCMYDKQMELTTYLSDLVLAYGRYLLVRAWAPGSYALDSDPFGTWASKHESRLFLLWTETKFPTGDAVPFLSYFSINDIFESIDLVKQGLNAYRQYQLSSYSVDFNIEDLQKLIDMLDALSHDRPDNDVDPTVQASVDRNLFD